MGNWEMALMALTTISAVGFLLADGEKKRLRWVQAMRRCLLRFSDAVRYEQPGICALLASVDLRATQQEIALSRLLRVCGDRLEHAPGSSPAAVFAKESARSAAFGVLSCEDRAPFEAVLKELGRCGLREQMLLIDEADERLRSREEFLRREGAQRARLMSSLGVCGGAAVFLLLI